jgi:6-phosphogluconolactonase (cycloisomerase 2 family)
MDLCGWLECPPGTGARHAVFSPDGMSLQRHTAELAHQTLETIMYVIGELSHTVVAFDLCFVPSNAILPIDGFAPNIIPPDIHPDHQFMLDSSEICLHPTIPNVLYVSNRWSRHIAQRQPELKNVPKDLPTGDDIAVILLGDDGKKVKTLKHVRTNVDVIRGMRLSNDGKYAVVVGQEGGGVEIYSITGEAGDIWILEADLSEGLESGLKHAIWL